MKKEIFDEYISKSEIETEEIALELAASLKSKDVVVLTGDLGAGKTKFTQGIAEYFGVTSQLSSPTFTIVNEYIVSKEYLEESDILTDIEKIYHFDVYRLKDSNDFVESVGTDYFEHGLCVIEWGEIIQDILPQNAIYISITRVDENENHRKISISRNV